MLVLPYLHPMALAKALATLDHLSRGRLIAGLGVGGLPEENEALGVAYEGRGPWSDEFIEVGGWILKKSDLRRKDRP